MNNLELIAVEKLRIKIIEIMGRANEKNQDRFQYERIFVMADAKEALGITDALIENHKTQRT
jgi:hypothetical protein